MISPIEFERQRKELSRLALSGDTTDAELAQAIEAFRKLDAPKEEIEEVLRAVSLEAENRAPGHIGEAPGEHDIDPDADPDGDEAFKE